MLSERIGKRKIIFLGLERLQMRIIEGFRTISCGAYRFFLRFYLIFQHFAVCRIFPRYYRFL